MHDALPLLTEKFLITHPMACRLFGCRRPVRWLDLDTNAMTIGWCDQHRTRAAVIPISIHGREGDGWHRWPEPLAHYIERTRSARSPSGDDCKRK